MKRNKVASIKLLVSLLYQLHMHKKLILEQSRDITSHFLMWCYIIDVFPKGSSSFPSQRYRNIA